MQKKEEKLRKSYGNSEQNSLVFIAKVGLKSEEVQLFRMTVYAKWPQHKCHNINDYLLNNKEGKLKRVV